MCLSAFRKIDTRISEIKIALRSIVMARYVNKKSETQRKFDVLHIQFSTFDFLRSFQSW